MHRRHSALLIFALLIFTSTASAGSQNSLVAPGQSAPINGSLPSINGQPLVGNTLTASTGNWNGPSATYSFQWFRCSSSGTTCAPVTGATGQSALLVSADAGFTIRVALTASNKNGTSIATSPQTQQVSAPPPPTTTTTATTTTFALPLTSTTATTATTTTTPRTTTTPTTTTTTATTTTTPSTTTTTTVPVGVNVSIFGAVGDGVQDDTAALQAAFKSGSVVYSSPGRTYRVSSALYVYGAVDLQGSTIKFFGGSTSDRRGLRASGSSARVANIVVDGNGRGGAVTSAYQVVGSGNKLTAANVTAFDTKSGNGTGDGFYVDLGGTLICSRCHAEGADRAGFFVAQGAGSATSISGSTTHCNLGAEIQGNAGGSIPTFTSNDDNHFGLILASGASNWKIGAVNTSNEGTTSRDGAATGVELWGGNNYNTFDSIVSNANPGYGLAIAGGSSHNTIGSFYGDESGAFDGDPGITITGGSSYNSITKATVLNYTVGLHIGEDNTAPNNYNTVGTLIVQNAGWGGIHFEYGVGNRVEAATLTNNGTANTSFPGDVDFGRSVSGNSVGSVTQSGSIRHPIYAFHASATATNNRVDSGTATSWITARKLDQNGSNLLP